MPIAGKCLPRDTEYNFHDDTELVNIMQQLVVWHCRIYIIFLRIGPVSANPMFLTIFLQEGFTTSLALREDCLKIFVRSLEKESIMISCIVKHICEDLQ